MNKRAWTCVVVVAALACCSRDKPSPQPTPPPTTPAPPPAPKLRTLPGGPRAWTPPEEAIVKDYMDKNPVKRLQIGAGTHNIAGWLNTDIEPAAGQVYLDAGAHFPFPDGTFKYVYAEQLIEHLTYPQAQVFVKESFRVLAPGGHIRLATPDLMALVDLFRKDKTAMQQKLLNFQLGNAHLPTTPLPETAWFNTLVRSWGHQFIYDQESLRLTLEEAGFKKVTRYHLGVSDAADLKDLEQHWQIGGKDIDEATSMYIEAVKP